MDLDDSHLHEDNQTDTGYEHGGQHGLQIVFQSHKTFVSLLSKTVKVVYIKNFTLTTANTYKKRERVTLSLISFTNTQANDIYYLF